MPNIFTKFFNIVKRFISFNSQLSKEQMDDLFVAERLNQKKQNITLTLPKQFTISQQDWELILKSRSTLNIAKLCQSGLNLNNTQQSQLDSLYLSLVHKYDFESKQKLLDLFTFYPSSIIPISFKIILKTFNQIKIAEEILKSNHEEEKNKFLFFLYSSFNNPKNSQLIKSYFLNMNVSKLVVTDNQKKQSTFLNTIRNFYFLYQVSQNNLVKNLTPQEISEINVALKQNLSIIEKTKSENNDQHLITSTVSLKNKIIKSNQKKYSNSSNEEYDNLYSNLSYIKHDIAKIKKISEVLQKEAYHKYSKSKTIKDKYYNDFSDYTNTKSSYDETSNLLSPHKFLFKNNPTQYVEYLSLIETIVRKLYEQSEQNYKTCLDVHASQITEKYIGNDKANENKKCEPHQTQLTDFSISSILSHPNLLPNTSYDLVQKINLEKNKFIPEQLSIEEKFSIDNFLNKIIPNTFEQFFSISKSPTSKEQAQKILNDSLSLVLLSMQTINSEIEQRLLSKFQANHRYIQKSTIK